MFSTLILVIIVCAVVASCSGHASIAAPLWWAGAFAVGARFVIGVIATMQGMEVPFVYVVLDAVTVGLCILNARRFSARGKGGPPV